MLGRSVVRGHPNPAYMGLPDRLRRARKKAGKTRAALAVDAGLERTTLYGIEDGKRVARLDTVEKIASALELSPCWLAFGVDLPSSPIEPLHFGGLAERLREVRLARGLSMREVGRRAEASVVLVRSTETGSSIPNLARLESLAKALDVSPCWLAYGVGPQAAPSRRRPRAAGSAASP